MVALVRRLERVQQALHLPVRLVVIVVVVFVVVGGGGGVAKDEPLLFCFLFLLLLFLLLLLIFLLLLRGCKKLARASVEPPAMVALAQLQAVQEEH